MEASVSPVVPSVVVIVAIGKVVWESRSDGDGDDQSREDLTTDKLASLIILEDQARVLMTKELICTLKCTNTKARVKCSKKYVDMHMYVLKFGVLQGFLTGLETFLICLLVPIAVR